MLASILVWLAIGLVAGWLATLVVRGVDCGLVGNCAFGSLGALLGGFLSATLHGGRSLAGVNLTGLLAACAGAFIFLRLSRLMAARWRSRHVDRPPAATCEVRGPYGAAGPREGIRGIRGAREVWGVRGIQRMDLLLSRFSEDEIDRLSKLQLHYREQPHVFDQALEERRLQFARWLVEHGRLSENVQPSKDERPWEEAEEPRHPNSGTKWPSGTSCRPLDGEPTPESACREPPEGWRAALLTSVSWLRQSIRTARATDRHSETPGRFPREIVPRSPSDGGGGYFEAPWLWMGLQYFS